MASQSNDGQNTSVEDAVKKMTCDKLIEFLRKEIPDERYKADLKILEDENIDGELFLDLPDDPDSKEVFDKLSGGGKAKIRKVVRGKKGEFQGQTDSRQKPVKQDQDMPWCTTQTPDDTAKGCGNGTTATNGAMLRAWIPANAVWPWNDKNEIYVEFLHVDQRKWTTGDGQPMNTDTVLLHANTWSDMGGGEIPRFVEAKRGKKAQIRVNFNNNKVRNSYLGKRAQNVSAEEPTMNLDLHNGCPSDDYKKYVIIHEFGHALGLGHEHQRSNFWRCIKPYTNVEKMKKDLGVNDEQFARDWKEIVDSEAGPHTEEYDPDSIMHYLFKVEWLTNGYSDKKKIERDHKDKVLSDNVARALLGVHKHRKELADKPSEKDIELLIEVYRLRGDSVDDAPEQKGAEKRGEIVFKQDYKVHLTTAYLSRMEWTEDGKQLVVRIYGESQQNWQVIGQHLGISDGELDGIGQDGHDNHARVSKVLGRWYDNACGLSHPDRYPKSWRGLINLLNHSGLAEVAKKVHKALLHQEKQAK